MFELRPEPGRGGGRRRRGRGRRRCGRGRRLGVRACASRCSALHERERTRAKLQTRSLRELPNEGLVGGFFEQGLPGQAEGTWAQIFGRGFSKAKKYYQKISFFQIPPSLWEMECARVSNTEV